MMGYVYNSVLCVKHKIYIMMIMFVLGVIGYVMCEISQRCYENTHGVSGEKKLCDKKWTKEEAKRISLLLVDSKVSTL